MKPTKTFGNWIWISLTLVSGALCQAQSIAISGNVVEAETKEAISFAHVYVRNTSFGTVSNAEGKYTFIIPATYANDTIVFSSVGFQSYTSPLQDLLNSGINQISLTTSPVVLQNVVISSVSARELWKQVVKKHTKMFTTAEHRLKGFYRTTFQEDGYFSRLLEAAVNIYGGGNPRKRADIEYLEIRKSRDLRKNIWTIYDGYLEHLVFNHPVRSKLNFLTISGMNKYEIEIVDQLYLDDDLYYVFKATGPRRGMFDAEMLVREKDRAIFKITLFWHPENSDNFSWAWERKDSAKFFCDWQTSIYEYQEFKGNTYPKRASWHRKGKVIHEMSEETLFFTESIDELLILRIDPGKFEFQNEIPLEVQDIYEMAEYFPYNKGFWSNFNRPVDSEYFQHAKSKMEASLPLEKQFEYASGLKVKSTY